MRGVVAGLAGVILAAAALIGQYPASAQDSLDRVNHIIVIYQENWSFDALYGKFLGADGFANAGPVAIQQVDKDNRPYPTLPQPINRRLTPPAPDSRFPTDLPNEPFNLAHFVQPTDIPGSPIHEFYREQHQINGGKLNKFVAWTDVGGLVMSYYDATNWPMGRLAQRFTLADNFFHAAFATYADGPAAKAQHLRDEEDFFRDLAPGRLPAVSFINPVGADNEHPSYTNPLRGQAHADKIVRAIMNSPVWSDVLIIAAYDENGGRWDHVAPPGVDRRGPWTRGPAVSPSPVAQPGFLYSTPDCTAPKL